MNETRLDNLLTALYYRSECPDTMVLADYQSAFLDEAAQRAVDEHVSICPHCSAELTRLEQLTVVQAAAPVQSERRSFDWFEEARRLIIRLLEPPTTARLAVVKGDGDADVLRRIHLSPSETGNVDIEAVVIATTAATCTLTARVQHPDRWPDLAGTPVRVSAEGYDARQTTNEDGEVTFSDIPRSSVNTLQITVEL